MITAIAIACMYLIILTIFIYKFLSTGKFKYFYMCAGTYVMCAITFITMATLGLGYNP